MKFTLDELQLGEETKYVAKPTAKALIPLILSIVFIPVAIGELFSGIRSRHYWITNQRVIITKKFFRSFRMDIRLEDISDVQVHQGIIGRLLNFGTVQPVPFSGTINKQVGSLFFVTNPQAVAETLHKLINQKQELRRNPVITVDKARI